MSARVRHLLPWLALVAAAGLIGWTWWQRPDPVSAGILTGVAAAAVLATFLSARRGRHTPYERARELIADDHAVVLWKPGCGFCEVLLRRVGDDPAITWVNVYEDPAADAAVRAVNGGDQLTPTALVGDRVLRNPSAADLRAAVRQDRVTSG